MTNLRESYQPKSPPSPNLSAIFGVEGTPFFMALDPVTLVADGILLEDPPYAPSPYIIVVAPDISATIDQVHTTTGASIVGAMNPAHLIHPPVEEEEPPPPDTLSAASGSDRLVAKPAPKSDEAHSGHNTKPAPKK